MFRKSFNQVDNNYFSVLEKQFLNEKNISFANCMWPNKVEKFNINSKFTKRIIHNKNIDIKLYSYKFSHK